jgi:hypothetical protein
LRYLVAAAIAVTTLGGCSNLMTPSGSAATRWAALEKSRAALANPGSGERMICKDMTVMGSNFPKKVCSTQAEWDTFNTKAHESVDAYDKDRKAGNTQGSYENQ